jgi:hypothetical protein
MCQQREQFWHQLTRSIPGSASMISANLVRTPLGTPNPALRTSGAKWIGLSKLYVPPRSGCARVAPSSTITTTNLIMVHCIQQRSNASNSACYIRLVILRERKRSSAIPKNDQQSEMIITSNMRAEQRQPGKPGSLHLQQRSFDQ